MCVQFVVDYEYIVANESTVGNPHSLVLSVGMGCSRP